MKPVSQSDHWKFLIKHMPLLLVDDALKINLAFAQTSSKEFAVDLNNYH